MPRLHDPISAVRSNRFEREFEVQKPSEEEEQRLAEIMRAFVSKAKFDAASFNSDILIIADEEQADRLATLMSKERFNVHTVHSLHLIMNANDFSPNQDDFLGTAVSGFADGHSLQELHIWIKGNTLFTRKSYTLTGNRLYYQQLKREYLVANKYTEWYRLFVGTATRQSLRDTPLEIREATKAVVRAILSLREIPAIYIHGVMETALKQEIMETCSSQRPRPRTSIEDVTAHSESMNITGLDPDSPLRPASSSSSSSASINTSTAGEDDVAEILTNMRNRRQACVIPARPNTRRVRSPAQKTRAMLVREFQNNPLEKVVLDLSSFKDINLAPGGLDEVVRISAHRYEPKNTETIGLPYKGKSSQTSAHVYEQMRNDCELGWKVCMENGMLKVGRQDELERVRWK
jgi:hypothetical protein